MAGKSKAPKELGLRLLSFLKAIVKGKPFFLSALGLMDFMKPVNEVSGLSKVNEIFGKMGSFSIINFTSDDIVRSGLVKEFILACEEFDTNKINLKLVGNKC